MNEGKTFGTALLRPNESYSVGPMGPSNSSLGGVRSMDAMVVFQLSSKLASFKPITLAGSPNLGRRVLKIEGAAGS